MATIKLIAIFISVIIVVVLVGKSSFYITLEETFIQIEGYLVLLLINSFLGYLWKQINTSFLDDEFSNLFILLLLERIKELLFGILLVISLHLFLLFLAFISFLVFATVKLKIFFFLFLNSFFLFRYFFIFYPSFLKVKPLHSSQKNSERGNLYTYLYDFCRNQSCERSIHLEEKFYSENSFCLCHILKILIKQMQSKEESI